MSDNRHDHHHRDGHHDSRPYWQRAHRDWRFWVAVVFIFAALAVYVMSDDLALVPRSHPVPTQPGPATPGTPSAP